MSTLSSAPWVPALAWGLIHFLWQGAVLALLLALALRFQRRASASARYLTACAALVAMALLVPLTVGQLVWKQLGHGIGNHVRDTRVTALADGDTVVSARAGKLEGMPAARDTGVSPVKPPSFPGAEYQIFGEAAPTGTKDPGQDVRAALSGWITAHAQLLLGFWGTGVLLLSLRLMAGARQLGRMRRASYLLSGTQLEEAFVRLSGILGVRRPVRIFISPALSSALTFGWLKPIILVPASALTAFPYAHLEAILAHELAHVRRHDYLVNLVQSIIEVLLFYHPAVWWVSSVIRREREHCCDDLAASACAGGARVLARALTSLEELRGIPAVPALSASGGHLLTRIRRLVGRREAEGSAAARWVAGMACVALILAGALAGNAFHPEEENALTTETQAPAALPPAPVAPPTTPFAILTPAQDVPTTLPRISRPKPLPENNRTPNGAAPALRPPTYSVLIQSGLGKEEATRLQQTLVNDGFTPVDVIQGTRGKYDVLMGRYPTEREAQQLIEALRQASYLPEKVINRDEHPFVFRPSSESSRRAYRLKVFESEAETIAQEVKERLEADEYTGVDVLKKNGKFQVLLNEFTEQEEARKQREILQADGYPGPLEILVSEKQGYKLVPIGPLPERPGAASPLVTARVFPLAPAADSLSAGRGDPQAAQEIAEAVQSLLTGSDERAVPPHGPQRFWYDPKTLHLTIMETPDNLLQVERFLAQHWVRRRLGFEDRPGTGTVELLQPGQVLHLEDLAVRLEQVTGERSLEIELLARLSDQAQVLKVGKYQSVMVGPYSITALEVSPGTSPGGAGSARVELWKPLYATEQEEMQAEQAAMFGGGGVDGALGDF